MNTEKTTMNSEKIIVKISNSNVKSRKDGLTLKTNHNLEKSNNQKINPLE